jgi:hypothetical protein
MLPRGNEDIQIVNHGPSVMTFSYWSGSSQVNINIDSGSSMGYYSCGTPTGEYIEITVTEDGNLHLENHWATDIIYNINNGINRGISGFTDLGTLVTGDIIRVYESHPNVTFRSWRGDNILGIINQGTGYCNITRMPPMNSFTSDSTGTVLGWCAFRYFARGPITHIMDGFDTSDIIEMSDHCFEEFARGNNERTVVETLPAESFKFPELVTAGHYVLNNFMSDQTALVALPLYSFRFPKLTTVGDNFCTSFASNSMLACIPYGSFDPVNLSSYGAGYIEWLFNNSRMRIDDSPYTTITNRCTSNIVMYYWNGSNQSVTITPGNYVSYHSCSIVVPDAFTISNATSVTPIWVVPGDPLLYTLDNGLSWAEAVSGTSITVPGDNIKFVGDGRTGLFTDFLSTNAWTITGDDVILSGNINTLLDHNNIITTVSDYAFINMFLNCTVITEAEDLVMPATTIGVASYAYMFEGCNNLLNTPDLPAMILNSSSYNGMFWGCINIIDGPVILPAETVPRRCYYTMFNGCANLITTPDISALTIGEESCFQMFYGCTKLLHATNILPAMTLGDRCYNQMFYGCTHLLNAPELPATTITIGCYQDMFNGCIKLTNVPVTLPSIILKTNCYDSMFKGCTSLITGPNLPFVGTLPAQCYNAMFQGCTSLLVAPNNDYYTTRTVAQADMFTGAENVEEPLAWCRIPANFGGGGNTGCTDAFTITNALTVTPRFTVSGNLSYSLDEGNTWANASNGTEITVTGENIKFKTTGTKTGLFSASADSNSWGITFDEENGPNVILSGNLNTILNNGDPLVSLRNYAYAKMFYDNEAIVEAGDLKLPSMALGDYCYTYMFSGCNNLRTAPKLPAKIMKTGCYSHMFGKPYDIFYRSTGITEAPELPAMTLAPYCYDSMFSGCFGLSETPVLPALTLGNYCYREMFYDCLGLGTMPELPADTLATGCYMRMFFKCSNLGFSEEHGILLPATTLAQSCYQEMFSACVSLWNNPILPATVMAVSCYQEMFADCESFFGTSSLDHVTTLAASCFKGMYSGCEDISEVSRGLLPVTTLAANCYEDMFSDCSDLRNTPDLPSTTLANYCYSGMFRNCIYITASTTLPAPRANLKTYCYYQMFMHCVSLVNAPALPGGGNLVANCYTEMFRECYALISAEGCNDYTTRTPAQNAMFTEAEAVKDPILWCNIPLSFGGGGGACKGVFKVSGAETIKVQWDTIFSYNMEYRYPTSSAWIDLDDGETITVTPPGTTVLFHGDRPITQLFDDPDIDPWVFTGEAISISGNLNALLGDDIPLTIGNYCFNNMFNGCTNLVSADIELPATTIGIECYKGMFEGCTNLTSLSLYLPAETLKNSCYKNMFKECTNLRDVSMPGATTLATSCYESMYEGCTHITNPGITDLPVRTLAPSCYKKMFSRSGITRTFYFYDDVTLAPYCFDNMYNGCTEITTLYALNMTTLAEGCYNGMFKNCIYITTTPELPAPRENLQPYCYNQMFMGCESLTIAPIIPYGGNLVANCYSEMFSGCSELTTAPNCNDYTTRLPAQAGMFTGTEKVVDPMLWCNIPLSFGGFGGFCDGFLRISGATEVWARYTTSGPSLQYRLASQTTWDTTLSGWGKSTNGEDILFRGTGRTSLYTALSKSNNAWEIEGENVKITGSLNAVLDWQTTGADINITANTFAYMFAGCDVITDIELLEFRSTTLAPYCYYNMFQGCTELRKPPVLNAEIMVPYCYFGMFEECENLREAPALPATTVASNCYKNMLSLTSITNPPELPATVMAEYCYDNLFYKTHTLLTSPNLPARQLAEGCYNGMFYDCPNLMDIPELPATVMAAHCYEFMFWGCISITSIPNNYLPSTELANCCYRYMFMKTGLINLTYFTLPATELIIGCYACFCQECHDLIAVNPNMIPATVLVERCYDQMFIYCDSLIVAPNLPITTLAEKSCRRMFDGCTALQGIPGADVYTQITTLPFESVISMFRDDTLITLPITYAQIPTAWK